MSFELVRRLPRLAGVPALSLLAACAGPTYLSPQAVPAEHTITVGGSASVDVLPDEACVELTLAARDPSMLAAHGALVAGNTALLADLHQRPGLVVEQGAESYTPEYASDSGGSSHLVRYVATIQVNVRIRDFTQIPDVIARAATRGLDRVSVVYYSTQIVPRKEQVRTQALEAAQQKARTMAGTLGVSLGEVVSIVEGEGHTSASVGTSNYLERGMVDKTSDAPAPPGAIPLSMNVTVVYRLR